MAILARRAGMLCTGGAIAMQERPSLAFGLLTVLLGAALAVWQTRSSPRRQAMRHRLRHGCRQFKAALDLPPLVIKLLANPLVQAYLRRTVLRAVSRKLGR
jgi:type IV secretory pathway TrbD component